MVRTDKRFVFVVIFAGLACVAGATLAFACTPSNFGTPATPAAPPPNTATPGVVPPVGTVPPATDGGSPASPVDVNVNTLPAQGVATSGAPLKTTGRLPSKALTRQPALTADGAGRSTGFARRAAGGTAGLSSAGGQPVFGSSPVKPGKVSPPRKPPTREKSVAPSARTAAGDLWTGFAQGERASVLAAEASARPEGIGATGVAALAALGLGLAGIAGTIAAVAMRSRRARSRSTER